LKKAIALRHKLWTVTNAVRLVNGAGDGLPGLLIDRYHCHVHIQSLQEQDASQLKVIQQVLTSVMPVDYMVV